MKYGDESTPELSDLQQTEEDYTAIKVPVKVCDIDVPIKTFVLPSRIGVTASYNVYTSPVPLLGEDLRRRRAIIVSKDDYIYVGHKDRVEDDTALMWPPNVPLIVQNTEAIYAKTAEISSTVNDAETRVEYQQLLNTSLAASGSTQSVKVDGTAMRRIRVYIKTSGADVTVEIETSANDGVTWQDFITYTTGATGSQDVIELPGPDFRLSASNAGVGAQDIEAGIFIERFEAQTTETTASSTLVSVVTENWAD